jgi:hypothetical protein
MNTCASLRCSFVLCVCVRYACIHLRTEYAIAATSYGHVKY